MATGETKQNPMKDNRGKLSVMASRPESYRWFPALRTPATPRAPRQWQAGSNLEIVADMDPWLAAYLVSGEFRTQFLWSSDCGNRRFAALGEQVRVSTDELGLACREAGLALGLPATIADPLPLGLFVSGQTDQRGGAFPRGETESAPRAWLPRLLILQERSSVLVISADAALRQRIARTLRGAALGPGRHRAERELRGSLPGIRETNIEDRTQWRERIGQSLEIIADRALEKIVVSRRLALAPTMQPFSPWASAWQVQAAAGRNGFAISTDGGRSMFLGATPETLLRVTDGDLATHALAGTLSGEVGLEQFMASRKLRVEHAYVSDGLSATLAPYTSRMTAQPLRIRRAGTVTHLETPLKGRLRDSATPMEVLDALHPTPAIGGWPRQAAVDALGKVEPYSRGWFAAPMGWLAPNGDAHAVIAIRSQWVSADQAVMLAGAGIVHGSDDREEWLETEQKFDNMRCVLRSQAHG